MTRYAELGSPQTCEEYMQLRGYTRATDVGDTFVRYRHERRMVTVWFLELEPGEQLTQSAHEFLRAELTCCELAACGGLHELITVHVATAKAGARLEHALTTCRQILEHRARRGLR